MTIILSVLSALILTPPELTTIEKMNGMQCMESVSWNMRLEGMLYNETNSGHFS